MLSILNFNLMAKSALRRVTITESPENLQLIAVLSSDPKWDRRLTSVHRGWIRQNRTGPHPMMRDVFRRQTCLPRCLLDKSFIMRLSFCGNVHSSVFHHACTYTVKELQQLKQGQAKSCPTLGRQTDGETILEANYFEET